MASRKKAFTLVELLAVIAIIGVLAGLVYAGVEKAIERAKVTKTRSVIQSLDVALTNFERDMGTFEVDVGGEQVPTGIIKQSDSEKRIRLVQILTGKELLQNGTFKVLTDIREDQRWNGPYLDPKRRELEPKLKAQYKTGQLVDAWGNPLMIRIKRGDYDKMMQHRQDSFEIYSWGANEADDGGERDDVTNWE